MYRRDAVRFRHALLLLVDAEADELDDGRVAELRQELDLVEELGATFVRQSHVHVESLHRDCDSAVQRAAVHHAVAPLAHALALDERVARQRVAVRQPPSDLLLQQRRLERSRVLARIDGAPRLDGPH